MSIRKYFKPVKKDVSLPNPHGPLSSKVPPGAIEAANDRVSETVKPSGSGSGNTSNTARGPYTKLTPAQRLMIGKRASEHGTTATMKYFSKRYPGKLSSLKETTVRRLKNIYQAELRVSDTKAQDLTELPLQKTGRPLMLGKELDKQVREYVRDLRAMGVTINTAVVLASAEGIIMHKDANLLQSIELTEGWGKYLLQRIGFVKRKGTTKAKISIEHFKEVKKEYLLDIKLVISMDEIPGDFVINFDQTEIHYIPVSDWTMAEEGSKWVEITGKDDKCQLTAVFAGTMSGEFLPPQLIYQGKTTRCLPHYDFPAGWHLTYSPNHWSNEETMKEYIKHIILLIFMVRGIN